MHRPARTRETRQRRVVYETIRGTKTHPTADWIFDTVRETLPKISLGTVYRNLAVLKSEGLVRELYGADRKARYDAHLEPHGHFICTGCGEIRDVEGISELAWQTLKDLVGCDVADQRVEFVGLCPACRPRTARA